MSKTVKELKENAGMLLIGLVAISLVLTSLNLSYTMGLSGAMASHSESLSALQLSQESCTVPASQSATLSGDEIIAQVAAEVIPTGVPPVYGDELKVSFDSVQDSINRMVPLDEISLQGAAQQRYVSVGTEISCEYCCGAQYITTPDGQAACGCDHSFAMRGLAKYLIQNHGNEFSDEGVLAELQKWKATFFPKQTIEEAIQLKAESGEINQSVLAGMPDMVGGC